MVISVDFVPWPTTKKHHVVTLASPVTLCGTLPSSLLDPNLNLQLTSRVTSSVLSVPAGEAPCERVFSMAGHVATRRHARMAAKTVSRMTYIRKNHCALKKFKR